MFDLTVESPIIMNGTAGLVSLLGVVKGFMAMVYNLHVSRELNPVNNIDVITKQCTIPLNTFQLDFKYLFDESYIILYNSSKCPADITGPHLPHTKAEPRCVTSPSS